MYKVLFFWRGYFKKIKLTCEKGRKQRTLLAMVPEFILSTPLEQKVTDEELIQGLARLRGESPATASANSKPVGKWTIVQ